MITLFLSFIYSINCISIIILLLLCYYKEPSEDLVYAGDGPIKKNKKIMLILAECMPVT